MLKKSIIITVPLTLIVGMAIFWYSTKKNFNPLQKVAQNKEKTDNSTKNVVGTFNELINSEESLECTWSTKDEVSGTTWIKNGKSFTELHTGRTTLYSITRDKCLWNWGNVPNQGIKICYKAEEEIPADLPCGEDLLKPPTDVDYRCKKTNVEKPTFEIPTNIEFMDLETIMQMSFEELEEKFGEISPEDLEESVQKKP
jgi:hypothetical protein